MRGRVLFLSFLLLATVWGNKGVSQRQTNIWYSPLRFGLNFNTTPVSFEPNIRFYSTIEGTSCMSDSEGRLLFYSSPTHIMTKDQTIMENGAELASTPVGASLIVPHPGNPQQFYVFITDAFNLTLENAPGGIPLENRGASYCLVDLSHNNGLGKVVARDRPLFTNASNKVTAVHGADCRNFWVAMHRFGTDEFLVYRVGPDGLDTVPVVSRVGRPHTGHQVSAFGNMKFSPDGNRLVVVRSGGSIQPASIEVFDFDPATGRVSTPRNLPYLGHPTDPAPQWAYLAEFSPNSNMLYIPMYSSLVQFDLSEPMPKPVSVFQYPDGGNIFALWGLQLASDGKIYCFHKQGRDFGVSTINQPDNPGREAGFSFRSLKVNYSEVAVTPNFVQSYFRPLSAGFEPSPACGQGEAWAFAGSATEPATEYVWDFGDPGSGAANRAVGQSARHVFSAPGEYRVRLTAHVCDRSAVAERTVRVYPVPSVGFPADTLLVCASDLPFRLSATRQPLTRYRWNVGNDTLPQTAVARSGWYALTASNPCGQHTDSVYVQVADPAAPVVPQVRVGCQGGPVTLAGSIRDARYAWDNGGGQRQLAVYENGRYTLRMDTPCGQVTEVFDVFFLPEQLPTPPNAFTPNRDGINEAFQYPPIPYPHYRFRVFGRDGRPVFQTHDPRLYWDGRDGGGTAPPGTYFYELSTVDCHGRPVYMKGPLTLLGGG